MSDTLTQLCRFLSKHSQEKPSHSMSSPAIRLKTSRRRFKIKKVNGTPRKALCRGHRGSDHGKTIVVLWMNIYFAYSTYWMLQLLICHGNEWRLCHNNALKFIKDIEPYLQIPYKINQIKTAIEKSKIVLKRRFSCKFCSNDYANPSGRRRHEKKVHPTQALVSQEARRLEAGIPLES